MSDTYRDDLTGLLASNGFTLLLQRVKAQWGPTAYNARVNQVIVRAQTDKDLDLKLELGKLECAQREINALLSWPQQELDKLATSEAREKAPVTMMRGGR